MEQRKRNTENERKRREKLNSDPDSKRELTEEDRYRRKKRVQEEKGRKTGELGEREQRHLMEGCSEEV